MFMSTYVFPANYALSNTVVNNTYTEIVKVLRGHLKHFRGLVFLEISQNTENLR